MFYVKVSKFQNQNMKLSHCPKYERKNLKISALSIQKLFVHILGNATTSYLHFEIYSPLAKVNCIGKVGTEVWRGQKGRNLL